MTYEPAHDIAPRMGRAKLWTERLHLTLPEGAKARMDAVLEAGEDRLDMIRSAVDKEVRRRERRLGKPSEADSSETPNETTN